jgi:threonylcarbamoyladenosine tRNA methylthiotransferase MtaB
MRVYVGQVGCRLNYSEMETVAAHLRAAGHSVVAQPEDAQVIVFNTCAVTADAARGSRKQSRSLNAANPQARIVLTGCWATLEPDAAAALPGVALVAGNDRKDLLPLLLEPWSAELDDPALLPHLHPESAPLDFIDVVEPAALRRKRTRAFIKVQDGCNNRCTFCVVTQARGASRSRPLGEIVAEVQAWAAQGVQEIVLTGVHLGSYGRDVAGASLTLKSLVAALLNETPIARIRLSSLEPWELAEGFFDLWAQHPGRLCPHLHLPLQAGADAQLRAMARRCTAASFRTLVESARAAIPDLVLTTDLIAGFPGESDSDHAATLAFVAEMRFADAHVFPYSPRAGTAAATFAHALPGDVKQARARALRAQVAQTGASERARFAGQVRPVLWEGRGQPLADDPAHLLWRGLTDNALRVQALAPAAADWHGQIMPVRLAALEGEQFVGECVL